MRPSDLSLHVDDGVGHGIGAEGKSVNQYFAGEAGYEVAGSVPCLFHAAFSVLLHDGGFFGAGEGGSFDSESERAGLQYFEVKGEAVRTFPERASDKQVAGLFQYRVFYAQYVAAAVVTDVRDVLFFDVKSVNPEACAAEGDEVDKVFGCPVKEVFIEGTVAESCPLMSLSTDPMTLSRRPLSRANHCSIRLLSER
jgi:hypothetical protein